MLKKNKAPTDYSYNKNRNRNVTSEYVIEFCKQYESKGIYLLKETNFDYIYDERKSHKIRQNTVLKFFCEKHGYFEVTYYRLYHMLKKHPHVTPCKLCNREISSQKLVENALVEMSERFETDARKVHGSLYDYSLVDFDNLKSTEDKIKIICPRHGVFMCRPENHIKGRGCPQCAAENASMCQMRVYTLIKDKFPKMRVMYEVHEEFLKRNSKFDIYMPEIALAVEYNGPQHFTDDTYYNEISDRHTCERNIRNDKDKYNASKENGVKIIYFTFSKNEYEYFAPVYNDLGDLYTLIEKRIKDFGFKLKDFK